MDTFSISTIILIVVITILIFVWQWFSKREKKNKNYNNINSIAKLHNCKISAYDFTNNIIIGTDEDSRFLFFFNKNDKTSLALQITEIERCKINLIRHGIGSGNNIQSVIDLIELVLTHKDSKKSDIIIECYNSKRDFYYPEKDLTLLEKWETFIKSSIKKNNSENAPEKKII